MLPRECTCKSVFYRSSREKQPSTARVSRAELDTAVPRRVCSWGQCRRTASCQVSAWPNGPGCLFPVVSVRPASARSVSLISGLCAQGALLGFTRPARVRHMPLYPRRQVRSLSAVYSVVSTCCCTQYKYSGWGLILPRSAGQRSPSNSCLRRINKVWISGRSERHTAASSSHKHDSHTSASSRTRACIQLTNSACQAGQLQSSAARQRSNLRQESLQICNVAAPEKPAEVLTTGAAGSQARVMIIGEFYYH